MESTPVSPSHLRLRLLTMVYGGVLFFWLSAEDNSALPVSIFGVTGSVLLAGGWRLTRINPQTHSIPQRRWTALLLGVACGAGAALLTTLLMFFKTAWHSHIFPDYPTPMMLAMLSRAPVWAVAGGLIALAWLLWHEVASINP